MWLHDNREENKKADNLFKEKHEITLIFKNQMKTKSQNIKNVLDASKTVLQTARGFNESHA